MPTPKIKERVPGRQSLKDRLRQNILEEDKVQVFGKPGTTTGAYGLAKPDKPMGDAPRAPGWGTGSVAETPRVKG